MAWANLEAMTGDAVSLPSPKPDHWDSTRPFGELDARAHANLKHHIQPTILGNAVFPNYTLEAKGSGGKAGHVRTQAVYKGAASARAMHSGLNYGKTVPHFDGNAYSLAYTYLDGTVRCFSTHAETPTGNRLADYHTRQLAGFDMTGSSAQYVNGVTLLRNGRDWANRERSAVIASVNEAHKQLTAGVSPAPAACNRQPSFRETRRQRNKSAQRRTRQDVIEGSSTEEDTDPE